MCKIFTIFCVLLFTACNIHANDDFDIPYHILVKGIDDTVIYHDPYVFYENIEKVIEWVKTIENMSKIQDVDNKILKKLSEINRTDLIVGCENDLNVAQRTRLISKFRFSQLKVAIHEYRFEKDGIKKDQIFHSVAQDYLDYHLFLRQQKLPAQKWLLNARVIFLHVCVLDSPSHFFSNDNKDKIEEFFLSPVATEDLAHLTNYYLDGLMHVYNLLEEMNVIYHKRIYLKKLCRELLKKLDFLDLQRHNLQMAYPYQRAMRTLHRTQSN